MFLHIVCINNINTGDIYKVYIIYIYYINNINTRCPGDLSDIRQEK